MPLFVPPPIVNIGTAVGSSVSPSSTAAAYEDMADMSVTLATTGGNLYVWFEGTMSMNTTGVSASVALSLDAAAEVAERFVQVAVTADLRPCVINHVFASVSAGSHTVKVRWKTNGVASLNNSVRQRTLTVAELKA